jgi:outer membrane protein OmpA-like peptidoglycan-associated protein
LEQKYNTNEISETKPMKLYSSLMLDEMTHDDTNLPKSTKQSHSSLDKSKISSSTSEQLNKSQTYDKISSNISSEINSEIVEFDSNSYQQKKVSQSKLDNYQLNLLISRMKFNQINCQLIMLHHSMKTSLYFLLI